MGRDRPESGGSPPRRRLRAAVAVLGGGVLVALVAVFVIGVGSDPGCACPPSPSFEFDVEPVGNGGVAVEIIHAGGRELPADRVLVVVDRRGRTWAGRADGSDGTVAPGDSVTVSARSDSVVRLAWVAADGGGRTILDEYTVPEGP